MQWRKLAYLALIAPLHHLLLLAASVPAMLLLPPLILLQLGPVLLLYGLGLWWAVPALLRGLGIARTVPDGFRRVVVACGMAAFGLAFGSQLAGVITTAQALGAGLLLLLTCHWVLISKL